MTVCLTRCIEFSPYSNETVSEDVRLGQVHAISPKTGSRLTLTTTYSSNSIANINLRATPTGSLGKGFAFLFSS